MKFGQFPGDDRLPVAESYGEVCQRGDKSVRGLVKDDRRLLVGKLLQARGAL